MNAGYVWPIVKLGSICDVKGGKRLPKGCDFSESGYPYIRARDIRDGKVTFNEPVFIDQTTRDKIKRYTVKKGDICITIVGINVGDVGIIPESLNDASLTENAAKLINLQKCYPEYLNYYLQSSGIKEQMQLFSSGAAQDKLGLYKIKLLDIVLPPVRTQKEIAAILSAYDDLIENNKRRIALLENMAEEIYREWFVRFRFPGYQIAEFEKGIPKGWKPTKFGSFCKFDKGKNPDKVLDIADDELTFYVNVDTLKGNLNSFAKVQKNSVVCRIGDTLMLMDGSRSGLTLKANVDGIVGSTLSVIRVEEHFKHFVYEYLKVMHQEIVFNNTGSAIPHANKDYINRMMLFIPDNEKLIHEFNKKYEVIFHSIKNLDDQNINLSKTKESLLPRLISGKLTVEALDIQYPPSMQDDAA